MARRCEWFEIGIFNEGVGLIGDWQTVTDRVVLGIFQQGLTGGRDPRLGGISRHEAQQGAV